MRLIRQSKGSWQYHLNQSEADILCGLVRKFPFTEMDQVRVSKTDQTPEAVEREKLLLESLMEHRKQLKQQAVNLLGREHWQQSGKDHWLTLESETREVLLQILNDIRIGCWHALSEPEFLDSPALPDSVNDLAYRNLMDLAGYFEMSLLESQA